MRTTLSIEFTKLFRPANYMLFAILLVLLPALPVIYFNVNYGDNINSLLMEIDTRQQGIIAMIISIFIIVSIGKEFSENTLRKSIIDGYTRDQFFTGKLLLLLVSALLLLLLQKLILLIAGATAGHTKEIIDYLTLQVIISSLLKIMFRAIFVFFLIFLTRSITISIVIYFLWTFIESVLGSLPVILGIEDLILSDYLPVSSMERMLSGSEVVALQFIIVPVAYQLIMLLISYWLLLKRDIK